MRCRLLKPAHVKNAEGSGYELRPAGFEIEHKHAFLLVRQGMAEPADEECRLAAGMTAEQIALAAERLKEIEAGITPENRALFRAGKILGYRPDYDPATMPPSDEYLHGPNWTEADRAAIDGDEDDEDEDEATQRDS